MKSKTAASLSALEERHLPVLVVAPKRVAENVWDVEQEKWRPDLTTKIAVGSPVQRQAALVSDADIVVISRDNLKDVLALKRSQPFRTLILDELSGFKSRASVRWKTARQIIKRQQIPHVWGLTGTPVSNGYLDLWPQVALLDGGARLGKNITTYRSRYFTPGRRLPNGTIIEWNLREEADQHIRELIADICLAMETGGRIKLPPVTYNAVPVELPKDVRTAYRELSSKLVADLREIFGGGVHTASNAAVLTSRLSQMTAGFIYPDVEDEGGTTTRMHTEKIKAVQEVVESDHTGGVLVFYRFAEEKVMLQEALGDQAHTIAEPNIVKRWNDGEIPVLLSHPASTGHGLNLQHGGHTVVWTSLPWDLEQWDQANKRLARQGQQHPVVIHMVLANKSIDHLIRLRLEEKTVVQKGLLDYLESPV